MEKETAMKFEEGSVELSIERIRNDGVEPWCLLIVLCFWHFVIYLHLI